MTYSRFEQVDLKEMIIEKNVCHQKKETDKDITGDIRGCLRKQKLPVILSS